MEGEGAGISWKEREMRAPNASEWYGAALFIASRVFVCKSR
jgi:hypothetical protein